MVSVTLLAKEEEEEKNKFNYKKIPLVKREGFLFPEKQFTEWRIQR